jgi:peptide/nickel transport system substrate-binding protein
LRLVRLLRRLGVVFAAGGLGALGCGPSIPAGAGGEPVVVRLGWTGSPDSLNPGVGVLSRSFVVFGLVYDTLFQLELDGSYSPSVAESWTTSPDGLAWRFTLRDDFVFHDDVPLTARDVAFSLELYKAHADFPYLHGYTDALASVATPDPRTVEISLSYPIADLPGQLGSLYILPAHVWAPWSDRATEFDNAGMIGSGPFRLVEFRPGEVVRLAAHRRHPIAPPAVDEVAIVTYGTGDTLVQSLRTGEVDAITEMPYTAIERLRRDPRVEVVAGASLTPRTWDIKLNQRHPGACPPRGVCSGHPALRDRAVRRALAMATPKQELIDVLLLGQGVPGKTLLQASLGRWFHGDLVDHPFDIGAARRTLDQAGYRDRDGDGLRETPDGSRALSFRFYFLSESSAMPRAAELIARAWERIGVRLDRRALDANALAAARTPAFDYDLILWSWSSDVDPSFILSVMASDELSQGANDTGWSDPEYDDLYSRQVRELDVEQRVRQVWRMQEIALRDVVYIVPFYPDNLQAFRRDRFRGWRDDAPMLAFEDRSTLSHLVPWTRGES